MPDWGDWEELELRLMGALSWEVRQDYQAYFERNEFMMEQLYAEFRGWA